MALAALADLAADAPPGELPPGPASR
jgi:hypothetical protein